MKQRIKEKLKGQSGFTLVELLVVLVIIAILAATAIPSMKGFIDDANKKAHLTEARSVYIACQAAATELYGNSKELSNDKVVERAKELLAGDVGTADFTVALEEAKVKSITYKPKNSVSITINSEGEILYGE